MGEGAALKMTYAEARYVQRVRDATAGLLASSEAGADLKESAARYLDALDAAVPDARAVGVSPVSLMERTADLIALCVDMGGRMALPTPREFDAYAQGGAEYGDALAASEEWAEAIEPASDGHSRKMVIRCSVLSGIFTGAQPL